MKEKRPNNNLRAWREFRELTQEQLAEKVGTTAAVISLLESGKRGLSLKWLLRFSGPLQATPGFILDHQPEDLPTEVLDVWAAIPEDMHDQALEILRTFSRTGTDG